MPPTDPADGVRRTIRAPRRRRDRDLPGLGPERPRARRRGDRGRRLEPRVGARGDDDTAADPAASVCPLVLAALGLVMWLVLGRALARLDRIRAEVDAIGPDQLERRIADDGRRDEVGPPGRDDEPDARRASTPRRSGNSGSSRTSPTTCRGRSRRSGSPWSWPWPHRPGRRHRPAARRGPRCDGRDGAARRRPAGPRRRRRGHQPPVASRGRPRRGRPRGGGPGPERRHDGHRHLAGLGRAGPGQPERAASGRAQPARQRRRPTPGPASSCVSRSPTGMVDLRRRGRRARRTDGRTGAGLRTVPSRRPGPDPRRSGHRAGAGDRPQPGRARRRPAGAGPRQGRVRTSG